MIYDDDIARCFHCRESLPDDIGPDKSASACAYSETLGGQLRWFCCAGCKAIARSIYEHGLSAYYEHRTQAAKKIEVLPAALMEELALCVQRKGVQANDAKISSVTVFIENLNCPACAWLIERCLKQHPAVNTVSTNLSARRTYIEWQETALSLQELLSLLQQVGYRALPYTPDRLESGLERESRALLNRLAVAGFAMMQAMMYTFGLYFGLLTDLNSGDAAWLRWAGFLCTLPVVIYSSTPFYRNAVAALKQRHLNMDVSVSLAIASAFVTSSWNTFAGRGSVYFDSIAMFAFLLLLGRYLELKIRTRANMSSLLHQRLLPSEVLVLKNEQWQIGSLLQLQVRDCVRVRSGSAIPADGIVVAGAGSVDESMMTGEALPRFRSAGSKVYAGALVSDGSIDIEVTATGTGTFLAQLEQMQDRALSERPAIQLLADHIAQWFVVAVFVMASFSWLYWHLHNPDKAFEILLAVLVITCPCALSLALPVAWAAATQGLLKRGFLIRRASVLQTLGEIDEVVLDKTGTLTSAEFVLERVECFQEMTQAQALAIAASLEQHSSHPIAQVFTPFIDVTLLALDVKERAGYGVGACINGGQYFIGRENSFDSGRTCGAAQATLFAGKTIVAQFYLRDTLRAEAAQFVRQLQQRGLHVSVASGDHVEAVKQCADSLGISDFHAELTPAQKLALIREKQLRGKKVLMLGDGINDGPVLSGADVSIAVGNSGDFARRSADVVLLADDLLGIVFALQLAHKTRIIVQQNLSWALAYNALTLPCAMAGWVSPWAAALGMSLSSLLVTLNALRLNRDVKKIPAVRKAHALINHTVADTPEKGMA